MESNLGSNPSYIWRTMLWGREVIEVRSRWRIGDYKQVSIYHHRWLPCPTTFNPLSLQRLPSQSSVSTLIKDEGCWKEQMIRNHFLDEDANRVLTIPLPRRPLKDQLVWTHDKRGQYKVNSGYYVAFHMKVTDMSSASSNHIG